jgi:hypothetical protein
MVGAASTLRDSRITISEIMRKRLPAYYLPILYYSNFHPLNTFRSMVQLVVNGCSHIFASRLITASHLGQIG